MGVYFFVIEYGCDAESAGWKFFFSEPGRVKARRKMGCAAAAEPNAENGPQAGQGDSVAAVISIEVGALRQLKWYREYSVSVRLQRKDTLLFFQRS